MPGSHLNIFVPDNLKLSVGLVPFPNEVPAICISTLSKSALDVIRFPAESLPSHVHLIAPGIPSKTGSEGSPKFSNEGVINNFVRDHGPNDPS